MSEETPAGYSYTPHNILMAGVSSQIALCSIIFGSAFLELYFYKPHHHGVPMRTGSELLFVTAWSCAAYFSAVGLVYFFRNFCRKLVSARLMVPFLGAVISSVSAGIFHYLSTLEEIRNYKEPVISFGGQPPRPVLPAFDDLIWQMLLPAAVFFVVTCPASLLFPHIYKILPKKKKEEILHVIEH
ncbi:MAG: hypothetical protein M3384_08905 [Acidobacteriota bacterium]|nr:hypothetical protein [Acidobacteriota bacterium]